MNDSYIGSGRQGAQGGGARGDHSRGGRGSNRDSGGFRIRLSENEMRSARALQDAFNLRSTVAVLGFALRTLGQMLEQGKLDELIDEVRSNPPKGGNSKGDWDQGDRNKRFKDDGQTRSNKANPFARPSKPQSSSVEQESSENKTEEVVSEGEEKAATSNEIRSDNEIKQET